MLKKLVISRAVIVLFFVVVVALQPSEYLVVGTAGISAPPAVVFAQIADFHKWEAWSPWAKLDPAAKNTFDGPPAGTGAVFAWEGNKKVGAGRMTITESHPDDPIKIKLECIKPYPSTATTEFTFKHEVNQTACTWSKTGEMNFLSKTICLSMNMYKMIDIDVETT